MKSFRRPVAGFYALPRRRAWPASAARIRPPTVRYAATSSRVSPSSTTTRTRHGPAATHRRTDQDLDARRKGRVVARPTSTGGDMAQLTLRSGFTGFLLGGVLAATALYIAAKTGITIGVGLTSVLAVVRDVPQPVDGAGIAKDFTVLENNATQSIATSAGYVRSSLLVVCLTAYMVMTGHVLPLVADGDLADRHRPSPGRADRLPDEAPLHQRGPDAVPRGPRLRRGAGFAVHGRRRGGPVQGEAALCVGRHHRGLGTAGARWLATPDPVQDPAHGRLGRPEGAVDALHERPRRLLLPVAREDGTAVGRRGSSARTSAPSACAARSTSRCWASAA